MNKILNNMKVLDVTQVYSGPYCCMQLADHGAQVIKVEALIGDQTRNWEPRKNGYSGYYAYFNRNKKGITLDLKTNEGKEALKRLIKKSDVVVENFKVGTFEKLGFSYEVLKSIKPDIIYASISGFGLNGPMAKRPCYDIVAQAESGMMSLVGFPENEPVKIGPAIADSYTGTYLALGIMMAMYQKLQTGKGCRVDVAMLDTLFSVMEAQVPAYTMNNTIPKRSGNADLTGPPWDMYHAKDGFFVIGCGIERQWRAVCEVMERKDLITDPKYATFDDRAKHYLGDLKDIIEQWSEQNTLDVLEKKFVEANVPFGRVRNIAETTNMEQIKARNMLWDVFDPGIGEEFRMPGTPIKIDTEDDLPVSAAPTLGQDNDTILSEVAEFSMSEIDEMRKKGIIV